MAREGPEVRRRERPGWLATAVGLLFLIAAGFAVGMVAGVAWEDPGLVLAYLTGETEDVAWSEVGAGQAIPEVAAAPAELDRPVDPQVRRERERAIRGDPPGGTRTPAVAAAPVGTLAVQVGAFATSRAAERLAGSLRDKGFQVYVSPGTRAGEARWRVRVGPLATRAEAEETAARLKRVEQLPTWILDEDAS